MSMPRADFHVTTVAPQTGETTRPQFDEMWRPQEGGGGFPWFRGRTPSPYNPSGAAPPAEPPYEEQGPPDQRTNKPGGMFPGLSGKDLMALLSVLAGTVGAVKGNGGAMSPTSATNDPAMQEVLNLMAGRLRKSEPMFDSVQAMTNGLLPTAYQRGNFTPFTDPGRPSGPTGGGGTVPPNDREF